MVWLNEVFEFVVFKTTSDRYHKILKQTLKGLFSRRYTQMNADKSFHTLQTKKGLYLSAKICVNLRPSEGFLWPDPSAIQVP